MWGANQSLLLLRRDLFVSVTCQRHVSAAGHGSLLGLTRCEERKEASAGASAAGGASPKITSEALFSRNSETCKNGLLEKKRFLVRPYSHTQAPFVQ